MTLTRKKGCRSINNCNVSNQSQLEIDKKKSCKEIQEQKWKI